MAQRSSVPKFGNWENEENVPYTLYFDKARKSRTGGKIINPNDPQENPDLFSYNEAPAPPSEIKVEAEKPLDQVAVRTTYENRRNREDGDLRQFRDSPARHDDMGRRASSENQRNREDGDLRQFRDSPARHEDMGRRASSENQRSREDGDLRQFRDSPARHDDMSRRASSEYAHQRAGRVVSSGETYKKPVRNSVGSENSFERSPLHNQARTAGRSGVDSSSPSWEGKSVYKNSHGTPGRSRMRPALRGDESPDRGAAVPKFGDWDENNPSSADGYTHIFNKVREEKNTAGRAPGMPTPSPQRNFNRPTNNDGVKSCCFPWGKIKNEQSSNLSGE